MLATHVRQGHGVPHLNQNSFTQLLEESLGHDEDGNPNLNDDAEVNHKLTLVVTQVGIDPFLINNDDNPFHSNRTSSKKIAQLRQCLAVLQLAITRSPQVLFRPVDLEESVTQGPPLYVYLLPRLFSVVGRTEDAEATSTILNTVSSTLSTTQIYSDARRETLRTFLLNCLTGTFVYMNLGRSDNRQDCCKQYHDMKVPHLRMTS